MFERKRTFYQSKGLNKGHSPETIRDDRDDAKHGLSKRSKSPMPFHGVNVSEPTGKFPPYKRTNFMDATQGSGFKQRNSTKYLLQY